MNGELFLTLLYCIGSAIYYQNEEQKVLAEATRDHYNSILKEAGRNAITTDIEPAQEYYFAEEYRTSHFPFFVSSGGWR